MPRSTGTYTAPSSSVNPAVEGTTIDETDFNSLVDDIETAFTESTYTSGLGSTDNRLVRTDGTDTKKVQGTGITVDDSNNMSGVGTISSGAITSSGAIGNGTSGVTSTGTIELGHASDTTLARSGAGDMTIEGNAVYRAGGTDVAIADGGTGQSTATAAFDALAPTTTQGDIIYHNGTDNVRLATGTAGQVLTSGGAGANPSWGAAGVGDLVAANNLSDVVSAATAATNLGLGTASSPQFTAVNIGHATDTTLARSGAGDLTIEGNAIYRAGGTDVAIADGGTGAGTAAAGFRALAEGVGSTQGDILYRSGTEWTALGTGTSGQVLSAGGVGANPSWSTPAGTGDVTSGSTIADNRLVRGDGGAKGIQQSGITVDDSNNITGAGTFNSVIIGALFKPVNYGLAAAVAANAVTFSLKDAAGSDPSGTTTIPFRSSTLTTGTPTTRTISAALTLTISSGSTMGVVSATPFRIWIVVFDDAGTIRLGAINCADATRIYTLRQGGVASSTAEGGAGAADSAGVYYTGTAVTSKAFRVVGFATWESGLTTAGTWDAAPTVLAMSNESTPMPGDVIQALSLQQGTGSATTSASAVDVTGATLSITPTSATSKVRYHLDATATVSAGGAGHNSTYASTFLRSATTIGNSTIGVVSGAGSNLQSHGHIANSGLDSPKTSSSVTYKMQHYRTTTGTSTATTAGVNMLIEEVAV